MFRVFKEIQDTLTEEEHEKCNGLPLILGLYSDGFDPENPLRSKGRNSITAVYLYILNLEEHHRSKINEFLVVKPFKSCHAHAFGVSKCFERSVNNLNSLIDNGIDISVGKSYPVRVAKYRTFKKEVNFLMRLTENFANTTYFSPYCYITQEDRNEFIFIKFSA